MKPFRQIYGISPSEYEQRFIDEAANNAGEPSTASSARSRAVIGLDNASDPSTTNRFVRSFDFASCETDALPLGKKRRLEPKRQLMALAISFAP
jgi:hypothetical protein